MTSPGTIKSIQKRFYTVVASSSSSTPSISRVRSNSASRNLYTAPSPSSIPLSFFDSPPPPPPSGRPSNPYVLSTTRLPIKSDASGSGGSGEGQQHHTQNTSGPFSLALTSPQPNSSPPHTPAGSSAYAPGHPFFPYNSAFASGSPIPFYSARADKEKHQRQPLEGRTRYQLDVGAYGIAKRRNVKREETTGADDLGLAVQVGEDAYFIRDNAMGVADGVGGWARAKHTDASPLDTSPSALFARRLMNFCSAEAEAATTPTPTSFSFPIPTSPRPTPSWPWSPIPPAFSTTPANLPIRNPHLYTTDEYADLDMDLEGSSSEIDELEEFEEGLDVLMILERAYESTIKAHVVPSTPPATSSTSTTSKSNGGSSIPIPSSPPSTTSTNLQPITTPPSLTPTKATSLLEGSSTALLAVLDHSPRSHLRPQSRSSASRSRSTSQVPRQSNLSPNPPPNTRSKSPTLKSLHPTPRRSSPSPKSTNEDVHSDTKRGTGAVLKIAHLGDCMGMLVRGDEIVWRSEEMWWSFNTPVQLGPLSPSKPSTHARTFTLPIEQDDILILASDGLSDNLWDEEVLDEVVRMRRSFLPLASSTGLESAHKEDGNASTPSPSPPPTTTSLLGRRTLAGMLSEALCSRARRVSERRPRSTTNSKFSLDSATTTTMDDEVPFARRAREQGRVFRGGKVDDISVVVAVISPADVPRSEAQAQQLSAISL